MCYPHPRRKSMPIRTACTRNQKLKPFRPVPASKKSSDPKAKAPTTERPRRITKEVTAMGWIQDIYGGILLVRQKRGRKLWSLPGGKIEGKETVEQGLIREVREETGLEVKSARFVAIFDRAEKSNLTILYHVLVKPGGEMRPQPSEIAEIAFRNSLPRDCTPSLRHFWKTMRRG